MNKLALVLPLVAACAAAPAPPVRQPEPLVARAPERVAVALPPADDAHPPDIDPAAVVTESPAPLPPRPAPRLDGYVAAWRRASAKYNGIAVSEHERRVRVVDAHLLEGQTRVDLAIGYVVTTGWVEAKLSEQIPVRLHAVWGIREFPQGEYLTAAEVERLAQRPDSGADMKRLPLGPLRFATRAAAIIEAKRVARTAVPLQPDPYATIRGDGHLVLRFDWSNEARECAWAELDLMTGTGEGIERQRCYIPISGD